MSVVSVCPRIFFAFSTLLHLPHARARTHTTRVCYKHNTLPSTMEVNRRRVPGHPVRVRVIRFPDAKTCFRSATSGRSNRLVDRGRGRDRVGSRQTSVSKCDSTTFVLLPLRSNTDHGAVGFTKENVAYDRDASRTEPMCACHRRATKTRRNRPSFVGRGDLDLCPEYPESSSTVTRIVYADGSRERVFPTIRLALHALRT